MNATMRWVRYWNKKTKRLGIFELKMAQVGAMCFALIIAKLFPEVLALSVWWFVALLVVCAAPVHYAFWLKKDE